MAGALQRQGGTALPPVAPSGTGQHSATAFAAEEKANRQPPRFGAALGAVSGGPYPGTSGCQCFGCRPVFLAKTASSAGASCASSSYFHSIIQPGLQQNHASPGRAEMLQRRACSGLGAGSAGAGLHSGRGAAVPSNLAAETAFAKPVGAQGLCAGLTCCPRH